MSIKADDIEIGKCYTTTMQGKPSIVKVIDIAGTAVEFTENAGRPGAITTVQKNRHVKYVSRSAIPKSKWTTTPQTRSMREFVLALGQEVKCD